MDVLRVATGLAVALACLAIGCGGDDGDGGSAGKGGASSGQEKQVREVLRTWAQAVADDDVEKACDQLTRRAQEKAAETIPGARSCEAAHRQALAVIGEDNRRKLVDQLDDVALDVKISGDEAELSSPNRPGTEAIKMRREDGEWKLDHNPITFKRD